MNGKALQTASAGPARVMAVLAALLVALGLLADPWGPSVPGNQPLPAAPVWVEMVRPGRGATLWAFEKAPTLGEALEIIGAVAGPPGGAERLTGHARLVLGASDRMAQGPLSGISALALGLGLDLNRATARDLALLPGIGPTLAERIVRTRLARGGFDRPEDVTATPGIGQGTLRRIRHLVRVGQAPIGG